MLHDPAVLIDGLADGLEERAAALDAFPPEARGAMPLFGIPVIIKDNIAVVGMPTTAGCPAFAEVAAQSAHCVELLINAGAIIAGRANMDQFATGVVGTRSPYGTPQNTLDRSLVPGGSSSGSAAAVAHGLVPIAIGTDTAGSGRVPAATQQIVGLKPTRGLLSTRGVVPACSSLDTVSIFATNVSDAVAVLELLDERDPIDPWNRSARHQLPAIKSDHVRIGVPASDQLDFVDDAIIDSWRSAVHLLVDRGARTVEVDLRPLLQAGDLLYDGPFLAERFAAVGAFVVGHHDEVLDVTKQIIGAGAAWSAADYHRAVERVRCLQIKAAETWARVDVIVLPTVPTVPTLSEVHADPFGSNQRLIRLTTFSNLLDMAAVTIPDPLRPTPGHGVTLHGPANSDRLLAALAADVLTEARTVNDVQPCPNRPIRIVVAGAHLHGEARNCELTSVGASLIERTTTAPHYKLWALRDGHRPALERVGPGGSAIDVEVWAMPRSALGGFVESITPPLAIGSIELNNGRTELGFVCEQNGVEEAEDITSFGGWRSWRQHRTLTGPPEGGPPAVGVR